MKRRTIIAWTLSMLMITMLIPSTAYGSVELGPAGTFSIISKTEYAITPGVQETDILLNTTAGNEQNMGYVMEIDPARDDLTLKAGYKNYTGTTWGMQTPSEQAKAAEAALKRIDPNTNVVGVINANFFNMGTGEPVGALVMNGIKYHDTAPGYGYVAVLTDGSVEIRNGSVPIGDDVVEAMGGHVTLVKDGNIASLGSSDRVPRSAVGLKADGTVVLFETDGRQAPKSVGMTYIELAETMLALGCVDALNLDGGGSSTFMTKREGTGKLTIQNSPSDGYERSVSGTLLVVSTAAPSGEFDHASLSPNGEYYTPGSTVTFNALGVDSSGAQVDLPDGLTYALADDNMGEITEDGVFTASNQTGEVAVQILQGEKVVGKTTIHIQTPDKISFMNDSINLKYGQESDLGMTATYQGLPINVKSGDLLWEITGSEGNGDAGNFSGNMFIASENNAARNLSVTATVKCTSKWDPGVSDVIEVSVGKEPVVVLDGGDNDGLDYNNISYVHADANGGGLVYETHQDDHGDVIVVHYVNRGGVASAEPVDIDSGKVRFGQKALRLDYDFRGLVGIEGACIGFDHDIEIPGSPTGIGFWCYAPENTPNLWVRIRVRDGSGTIKTLDFTTRYDYAGKANDVTAMHDWNVGTCGGINWVGWRYLECDLSEVLGPITLLGGETIRIMDTNGAYGLNDIHTNAGMGTIVCQKDDTGEIVYGPEYVGHQKGSLYIDNLQLVYGTNNADTDNPVIQKLQAGSSLDTAEDVAADGSTVIKSNHVTFYSEFADVENENTSGLDFGYIYLDGVNMHENPNFVSQITDGKLLLNDMILANGTHTVKVLVHDQYGNEATVSRTFTVQGNDDTLTSVNLVPLSDSAPLGGVYQIDLRSNKLEDVKSAKVEMNVENSTVSAVEFESDYTGSSYTFEDGVLTLSAVRAEDASGSGEGNIATISMEVPSDLERNSYLIYSVTEGNVEYTSEKASNVINTFALAPARIPVEASYSVDPGVIVQGDTDATITVTDKNGNGAEGVTVYRKDTSETLGQTDGSGTLITSVLNNLTETFTLYAKGVEGYSFPVSAKALPAAGKADGTPYYILENATENAYSTKSISWMANPLGSEMNAVIEYALKSDYENNSEFTHRKTGNSLLKGFIDSSARLNNVTITGLQPNTEYCYRVGDGTVWSEVRTFDTIDNDIDTVTKIFLLGDTQTAVGETDNITKINDYLISKPGANENKAYSLGIQLGDAVEEPARYDSWEGFLNAMEHEGGAFNSTDMLHVIGNHEQFADPDAEAAKAIFTLDQGKEYYSVTYGNVYIATIDYTTDLTKLQEAADWLKEDAKASDAPWKILVMHQPPYYTNPEGGNGPIHEIIPPAVDEAGIDFVFSGHDHSYARTEPLTGGEVNEDGTYYYICGSTGEKAYGITDNPDFHFAMAQQDYTAVFLTIEATDSKIDVNTMDLTTSGDINGNPYYYMIIDTVSRSKHEICLPDEHQWIYRPGRDLLLCEKCGERLDKSKYSGFAKMQGSENDQVYMIDGELQKDWIPVGEEMYYAEDDYIVYPCTVDDARTCTVAGQITYHCEKYNQTKKTSNQYPKGHQWSVDENGEYVLNQNGHRTCSVCGKEGIPLDDVVFQFGTRTNVRANNDYSYNGGNVFPASFGSYKGKELNQSGDATLVTVNGKRQMRDLYRTWTNAGKVGKAAVHYEGKGDYYGEKDLEYVIHPANVENLKVTKTGYDSATLTWDEAQGAESYDIYLSNAKGEAVKKLASATGTTTTVFGLDPDTTYYFVITAVAVADGETLNSIGYFDAASDRTLAPPDESLTEELYVIVDEQRIEASTVDGVRYFFLPASADLSALELHAAAKDSGDITVEGNLGSAELSGATNVSGLATATGTTRGLTLKQGTKDIAFVKVMTSSQIPAIYLNSTDKENAGREYVDASKSHAATGSMKMISAAGQSVYDGDLTQIKARGNSTFTYSDKKSYQIKLAVKSDLLSAGEQVKTWVLLAGNIDAAKVRDKTMKDLAASLGMDYTASAGWANLYYDGEFRGLYEISEKNSVGSTSVNITDMEDAYKVVNENYGKDVELVVGKNSNGQEIRYTEGLAEPEDLSGGYLLEINNSKYDEASGFITAKNKGVNVKSPEYAGQEAMEYISGYWQEFEDAVYATGSDGSYTGYNESTGKYYYDYVDKESLVKYFLMKELSRNPDAFFSSTFFYKEKGSDKMVCGPIWDQEMIFGTGWNTKVSATNYSRQYLEDALVKIPDFQEAVRDYYQSTFADKAKALVEDNGALAQNTALVADSATMDSVLWGFVNIGNPSVKNHMWAKETEYADVVKDMTDWVEKRLEYLDKVFGPGISGDLNPASSGGSGSGGGGGGAAVSDENPVNLPADSVVEHGSVTSDVTSAKAGDTVTITVTPDEGYKVDNVKVTDKNGKEVAVTDNGDGTYSFKMPDGGVTVEPTFIEDENVPLDGWFVDVPDDAYYYDPVKWAVEKGATNGIDETHFGPDLSCTRAQMVTFLWRAAGSPEPGSAENSFTDVEASSYYEKAVLWAVEKGITLGTSETTFSPEATVTRGQSVTFLYRFTGEKTAGTCAFTDVEEDAYYYDAVLWAAENGVTTGKTETTFAPEDDCTRAQIVTFLYRAMGE